MAQALGLVVDIHLSDGRQPVGRGVGPALEALDVLKCCATPRTHRKTCANARWSWLAEYWTSFLVPMVAVGRSAPGRCSGTAERKFIAICEAQGGFRQPSAAPHRTVFAARTGWCRCRHRQSPIGQAGQARRCARAPAAGLEIHVRLDQRRRRLNRCRRTMPRRPANWRTPTNTWPSIPTLSNWGQCLERVDRWLSRLRIDRHYMGDAVGRAPHLGLAPFPDGESRW